MGRRLDFVTFRVDDEEIELGFLVALDLAERAARTHDEAARAVGARIRAAGASRPIVLSPKEQAAFASVIDAWTQEAESVSRLRERLP